MEKLRKAGFNFGEDEHLCYTGCVYFYNGKNYIIGGIDDPEYGKFTELDQKVSAKGSRLATEIDLLNYIENNGYSFEIKRSTTERYYYADLIGDNGHKFSSSGPTFDIFLYKSVFKIARYLNLGR